MSDDTYLTGKLLLAMPQLSDPRFHRSVILMCSHDAEGAMGLILNQPLPGLEIIKLLEQLDIPPEADIHPDTLKMPILCGGPVEPARGFLLHSRNFNGMDTIPVSKDFAITGTAETFKKALLDECPAEKLLILGYAGWSSGQLEQEIQQNSWLVTDADKDLVFHVEDGEMWDQALRTLGFDPALLSSTAGHA